MKQNNKKKINKQSSVNKSIECCVGTTVMTIMSIDLGIQKRITAAESLSYNMEKDLIVDFRRVN